MLAFAIADQFETLEALFVGSTLGVIVAKSDTELTLAGELLEICLEPGGKKVALNPGFDLDPDSALVVFSGEAPRSASQRERMALLASFAAIPVIALVRDGTSEGPSFVLAGADYRLIIAPLSAEMLGLVFDATLGARPKDLALFPRASEVTLTSLAAHVRPGRSPEACLRAIQLALPDAPAAKFQGRRLRDLHGYGDAKVWGLELAADLENWRAGGLGWSEVDHRSRLLSGPPGVGKTAFAGALANTLQVPLISSSVAEWNAHDNLSGTLRQMKQVFEEAIKAAPAVLLIDEIDGIADRATLSGRHAEYWVQIVNLLLELVTAASHVEGLVMIAATNFPERIDRALLRAGRLDCHIKIDLPDGGALVEILRQYVGGALPLTDLSCLARRLKGKTGADIEKLVRSAKAMARRAVRNLSAGSGN